MNRMMYRELRLTWLEMGVSLWSRADWFWFYYPDRKMILIAAGYFSCWIQYGDIP